MIQTKDINTILERIEAIEARNKKVELSKAWETSAVRKLVISVLTYFTIVIFFFVADLPKPFINSIVPSLGFLLSTLSIDWIKKRWLRERYRS